MNPTNRTKLEQGRAAFAYICAEEGAQLKDKASEYKAYAKKIPMFIKVNGLGATMAFVWSKGHGNKAYKLLYNHIERWLLEDEKNIIEFEEGKIAAKLTEVSSPVYRAVTIEVLAFLNWVKRFADALIEKENNA